MKLEAFEILHEFNDGMEKAIGHLQSLGSLEGFDWKAVSIFIQDAERVRAGVNRYMAEMIRNDADSEAARIDKERAGQEGSEKREDE